MSLAFPSLDHLSEVEAFFRAPHFAPEQRKIVSSSWALLTIPPALSFYLFFRAISFLTHYLYLAGLSHTFRVLSDQSVRIPSLFFTQLEYRSQLLMPAYNVEKIGSYLLRLPSPIAVDAIKLAPLKKGSFAEGIKKESIGESIEAFLYILNQGRFFSIGNKEALSKKFGETAERESLATALRELKNEFSTYKHFNRAISNCAFNLQKRESDLPETVSFYSSGGVCRGASIWFISLLLHHPEKKVEEVASLFQNGVPAEGLFLQAFNDLTSLLKIKGESLSSHFISEFELSHEPEMAREKVSSLPPGIYRVGCMRHSLVYIKVDGKKDFLWDPNVGLLKSSCLLLLCHVRSSYYKRGDYRSILYFERYTK